MIQATRHATRLCRSWAYEGSLSLMDAVLAVCAKPGVTPQDLRSLQSDPALVQEPVTRRQAQLLRNELCRFARSSPSVLPMLLSTTTVACRNPLSVKMIIDQGVIGALPEVSTFQNFDCVALPRLTSWQGKCIVLGSS